MTETSKDPKASHNSSGDQQAVLKDALSTILAEARRIKDDSIRIGGIAYPTQFRDEHTRAILHAVLELDPGFAPLGSYGIIRLSSSYKSAIITYPGHYCLEKLFEDRGQIVEDEDPVVLLFEVSFGELHIVLGRVGVPGTIIEEKQSINWPASVDDAQGALQHTSIQPLLSEVVSVIFSSEDAAADFSKVRAALGKESSSLIDRVQIPTMGPEYVAATGAACRARQIVIFPEVLQPLDAPYYLMDDELWALGLGPKPQAFA